MAEIKCAHDEIVPLHKLVPNPRNPNTHPERQIAMLAKIIDAQGWRAPITVSNRSGFIVRGHGRYAAAQKLGLDAVPVDLQDYANEAEEWADLIADNKIAELAEMDVGKLSELLEELDPEYLEICGADDIKSILTLDPVGNLGGTNYGDATASKVPMNILGIGGLIDRELMQRVHGALIERGADINKDNGDLIAEIFLVWMGHE